MTAHSTYESLRHFADSWALMLMIGIFVALIAWPLRPGGKERAQRAATMIFDEDDGNG